MTSDATHYPAFLTPRQKDTIAVLCVIFLSIILFWRFLILGEIPLNADWLAKKFYPWRAFYPDLKVQNAELDDPIILHYPLWVTARQMLRAGIPPIWNPYIFCGAPLLADSMCHPFDALNLATLWIPDRQAWGYVLFFSFLIAGLFFYFFMREIAVSRLGAFVGAACYMLNGFFIVWAEYRFVVGSFCWVPVVFIALERVIKGRSMAYALLGGTALGFLILAANLHFLLIAFLLFAAYALWRIRRVTVDWGRPTALRALRAVGIMLAVGIGLSAIQWLPTLEYLPYTQRNLEKYKGCNFMHPLELLTLVAPNFFGNPAGGSFEGNLLFPRSFIAMNTPYIGVMGLMLAFVGLWSWRRRPWARFFGIVSLGVIAFLLSLNFESIHFAVNLLVPIDTLDHHRMLVLSAMGLAVLAGFGMDELQRPSAHIQRAIHLAALAGFVFVGFTVGLSLLLLPWLPHAEQLSKQQNILGYLFFLCGKHTLPILAPNVGTAVVITAFAAFLAFEWRFVALRPRLGRVLPYACAGLLVADILYYGMRFNPFVPPNLVYPNLEVSEFLRSRQGLWRISGLDTREANPWKGDSFPPSSALPYGITDVRGKDGFYPARTRWFMVTIKRNPRVIFEASVHFDRWKSKLLNLLGMRYLVSPYLIQDSTMKCIFNSGVLVYENPAAFPRAFVVHKARVIDDLPQFLLTLFHEAFEPDKEVLLEEEPYGFPLETHAKSPSAAHIIEYTPTRVAVEVEMKAAGFLVLTDAYAPGWTVTVNGVPGRLLSANLLLRCVPLYEGKHRVEFRYRPLSFTLGTGFTLLTLISLPALFFVLRRS